MSALYKKERKDRADLQWAIDIFQKSRSEKGYAPQEIFATLFDNWIIDKEGNFLEGENERLRD